MASIGQGVFAEHSLASAATVDIGSTDEWRSVITGTTTITSFGIGANKMRFLRFAAALILTHNATSLILPGAANIATAAGDTCIVSSDGSSNWRVLKYQRASGKALIGPSAADISDATANGRGILTSPHVGPYILSKNIAQTYNLTTASGNLDITGYGFNPVWADCQFSISGGGIGGGFGNLAADASQGCMSWDMTGGTTIIPQSNAFVCMINSAGTAFQIGVASFITDGIRIAFTKVGSPTGTMRLNVRGFC